VGNYVATTGEFLVAAVRPTTHELATPERSTIPAVVTLVGELGAEAFVYSLIADDHRVSVTAPSDLIARVEPKSAPRRVS
jgi:hypothetical protein